MLSQRRTKAVSALYLAHALSSQSSISLWYSFPSFMKQRILAMRNRNARKVIMLSHLGVEIEPEENSFFLFKNFFSKTPQGGRLPMGITSHDAQALVSG